MPGNTIKINNSDDYEWYLGDSKMEGLLQWLEKNGIRVQPDDEEIDEDKTKMELLDIWMDELIFPGKTSELIQLTGHEKKDDYEIKEFFLYTTEHRYLITACDRNKDEGYLMCEVQTRKKRAGEDWYRGNDLPDGPFNKATWNRIKDGIIKYELIKLSTYTKPLNITKDDILGD